METLYNGIQLPKEWPPRNMDPSSLDPMPVPYLEHPPEVIPIDVGRQLFVDDFLVEHNTCERRFHHAQKHAGNPVLKPETMLEIKDALPLACPKSGGVWWDPADKLFKMWYEAGWLHTMAYATSRDGLKWERPVLDVEPASNRLVPDLRPDSTTIFLDHDARDPAQRFKMFLRSPGGRGRAGNSMVSADGIHWSAPVETGLCGDRSTMFYNAFRKKWIYSIRSYSGGWGRIRHYQEHSDFMEGAKWAETDPVFWTRADRMDLPDPAIGDPAQLYNLDAVSYESLLLGLFEIHLGPDNKICAQGSFPKTTELMTAFSRDGFHWHRPDRTAFIPAARQAEAWDRGYVQSAGGICLVMDNELWFYYIGFQGDPENQHSDSMQNGMYANGSTGLAVLRRDGFASVHADSAGGKLTTRTVRFSGRQLFVNADAAGGELRVEILDQTGKPITPYTLNTCLPIQRNGTRQIVLWQEVQDLAALSGQPVKFRFHLKGTDLYSFWISPDKKGASGGFVAAGGPNFSGSLDR